MSNKIFNRKRAVLRKSCLLLLLVLALFGIGRIWYFSKAGFNINRILFPLQPRNDVFTGYLIDDAPKGSSLSSTSVPSEEILALLKQPYRYLGSGRQCYAFESFDGRIVLKIPRLDRYRLPLRWQALPSTLFETRKRLIYKDRKERLAFLFESFRLAFFELSVETGLSYLHLHPTEELPKEFFLYDRLHRRFCIDLNKIAFALQVKMPLMIPTLLTALNKQDRKKAEEILDALFMLIEQRSKLGIFNKDPSFFKNFGWEKGKGIQIDIGSFYRKSALNDNREVYRLALEDSSSRIRQWLAEIDPALRIRFDERLQECLSKSF